ncbi:short-chain dehydrogenase [Rhizopogon vinicolor AM-OR11-026]|uniref:Short-chain dehydrogenase n=1 Tax=Rhizopogon vinicolor AM-OR11-026 TaxID=1314800 RepID=A0A1B7MSB3_9AGAM|nr:short-chain dehydrogenase [Rhizopogon vinicolor AM-OR11-026]
MKKSALNFYIEQWSTVPPVEVVDLSAETVLVVGANVGIGFEASKHFARMQPARLIMACRSESKGKAAVAEIEQETGYNGCELRIIDLADFASVVAFADKFEKEIGGLHILVMNAGVLQPAFQLTTDGWESMLQVNYLATSLLSLLLIPQLVAAGRKSSRPSRMVIVSSDVHYLVNPTEEVKASAKPLETLSSKEWSILRGMQIRYFESNLFKVFFVRALTDRLQSITPLSAVAVSPGYCYSQFRRSFHERTFSLINIIVTIQERLLASTTEQGSRQLVFAAVGKRDDEEKIRGAYLSRGRVEEVADFVLSDEGHKMQDTIWKETIDILSDVSDKIAPIIQEYLLP